MFLKACLLAVLTVAIYWPAICADFIYDDAHFVIGNDIVRFGAFQWTTDRPVTLASYWLNFHTTGSNPMPFHLVNLAIHLLNGYLVFLVAVSVFSFGQWGAMLTSGVFLLHPLASEAVIYISGRSELLAMMFMLASVLLFSRSQYLAAGLAFVLAAESKQIGLVTPILWWITSQRSRKPVWPIIGCAVAGLALSPLRVYLAVIYKNANFAEFYAILSLLGRSIWPFGLSVDHDFTSQPAIYGAISACILVIVSILTIVKRQHIASMAFLWIGALTLPHVLVEPQGYLTEHHFYGPMLGVSIILASILQFKKGNSYEQLRPDYRTADQ